MSIDGVGLGFGEEGGELGGVRLEVISRRRYSILFSLSYIFLY